MLVISGGMVSVGLWFIAPFMGAELLLLVYVFDKVGKSCHVIERVIIESDVLTIRHEEQRHPGQWTFPLYWVNVDLTRSRHPWYGTRLRIGAHGHWIELARFLNNVERASLATALKTAIRDERQPQWGKT